MSRIALTARPSRRASLIGATTAMAGLALVAVLQGAGGASAASQTQAVETGRLCAVGTACLWVDAEKPGSSDLHLVITPGSTPDMEEVTPDGVGVVRSTTGQFHDNITQGGNHMAMDLCLLDTGALADGQYESWGAIVVIAANGGWFWAPNKDPFNDKFDTYTTAKPGECPSYIRFRGSDSTVLEAY